MRRILPLLTFTCVVCSFLACQTTSSEHRQETIIRGPIDPLADDIVTKAILAHGGSAFDSVFITFDFRDKHYTRKKKNGFYEFSRSFLDKKSNTHIKDILTNQGFIRLQEGDTLELPLKESQAYSSSVNSVIYFAELPYRLNDPAAIKSYLGETTIKGEPYHKIKVTFRKENGGKDFDDEFVYWIHRQTHRMDYLAYLYHTNGGGLRFRKAFNGRNVNGIFIQDYINYKPADTTVKVEQLDKLFELDQLTEVSHIELKNVTVNPL